MNIVELLRDRANTYPSIPAIIDTRHGHSRILTFGDLEAAAGRAAALLHLTGLRPGDVVLVFQPMSAELYVALLALFRLGLLVMFLDPSAGKDHIERCCALRPPDAFIAGPRAHLLRLVSKAIRRIPRKFSIGLPVPGAVSWDRTDDMPYSDQISSCSPETPALLTFTSGSTGQPKAAIRTHGFLLAQHRVLEQSLGLKAGEIDLATMPIFVWANLASGVSSLIPNVDLQRPGAIDPARVLGQIRRYRPTRTTASPAFLDRLASYCERNDQTLPSFRKIFTGGAPVFPYLLDRLQRIASHAQTTAVYGSTEAEPIAHIRHCDIEPDDLSAMLSGRGLLAGPPVPTLQLRILPNQWGRPIGPYSRLEFGAACLPRGEAGEIVVTGDHVLPGYLNGYGDGETKFTVDGTPWHRTGDAGYLDARGRLWLLGRCAACVEDIHGTLYPLAVECVAHQHPAVRRAAVVLHQDHRTLAVELHDHRPVVDLTSLKQILGWAHIEQIQVHTHIPVDRRHNAKIDYAALRRLLAKRGVATLKHRWSISHNFLAGITAGDWWRLLRQNRFSVDRVYWHRAVFVSILSLFNSVYRKKEQRLYSRAIANVQITKPPVFILGYWRSGTTYLHYLLAQDTEQFAYPNTYQVANPHHFLSTEKINSQRFAALVPKKRPMDNMALSFQAPQEDEFAPCLMTSRSMYLGITFPRREDDYERYLTFRDVPNEELEEWRAAFRWFLKKLTLKYDRALVLKSPPHTARIRLLLELFPDARFVHIHRNPYTVFQSFQHYFDTAPWHTYLQRPDLVGIDDRIIRRYKVLYDAFFEQRELIPEGHFHEVAFEELEHDSVGQVRMIYHRLNLPGFEAFQPKLQRYVDSLASYQKNEFPELVASVRHKIAQAWHRSFEEWGYPY